MISLQVPPPVTPPIPADWNVEKDLEFFHEHVFLARKDPDDLARAEAHFAFGVERLSEALNRWLQQINLSHGTSAAAHESKTGDLVVVLRRAIQFYPLSTNNRSALDREICYCMDLGKHQSALIKRRRVDPGSIWLIEYLYLGALMVESSTRLKYLFHQTFTVLSKSASRP